MTSSHPAVEVTIQVPAELEAWERAKARVTIRNGSEQPILPVLVALGTARGTLASWGIEGWTQRWGQRVRGRRTELGGEILLGPQLQAQQLAGPPSALQQAADMEWIRLEPLMPGTSAELSGYFDAAYQHGDSLDTMLVYIDLDPRERPICTVAAKPFQLAFVPCESVSDLASVTGADVYLPAEELWRGRREVHASTRLHIQHPEFDIADARASAGVMKGPFGYNRRTNQWILVDAARGSTHLVGETGASEELPGDWLDVLISLAAVPEITVEWQTDSEREAERTRSRLEQAGIEATVFVHKGHASPTALLLTLSLETVGQLARLMREKGARLEESQIIRQ